MANALAGETSPYLLQHAGNPVDWLPWGPEALSRAREQDRPLLVSIGYSACHWCHVMERESFEDPQVASLMNERFICVKVDREERPDIDALYMEAVQAMTGHGGWPLNVFLTPEQVPFHGGTYFPPAPRPGMASWSQVLEAVADAWDARRDEIRAGTAQIAEHLAGGALLRASAEPIEPGLREQAVERLRTGYDSLNGGWGTAPKFPSASVIEFLLARGETAMSLQALRSMASGGIFDQIGGGFARYSVDAAWTVPHFEKMLYDNALLARVYLHGWQVSGDPVLRRTCEETLDWALREMEAPDGGFFSALDADSEGVEGRFYVWTVAELRAVLGEDADVAIAWLGATQDGNFHEGGPGLNVLESRGPEPDPQVRERVRTRLLEERTQRVRPATDDKRLASWNALMLAALADAGAALGREDLLQAARRTGDFLLGAMRDADGRLLRTYNRGAARIPAYLEDHAHLLEGLIALYEATFEERWFDAARATADHLLERFSDTEHGGFFSTASDAEPLIARRKELEDAPIPSGGASAALGLLRLALLTGEGRYEEAALGHLRLVHPVAARHATGFGHTLQALDLHLGPARELALVGDDLAPLLHAVRSHLRPRLVLAGRRVAAVPSSVPLLEGREPVDGLATAYLCERFTCRAPVTSADELLALLDR
ncbi:unannotated protein [freshwater metagenome]|uniref:Unannotated protein n=1 Tax=freshwater metagenome TaxID=449393 RepID=A0A6J7D189_9ZZZZ|nr:DUF255 domain-containing protein [Actinomycetota bacterium]